MLDELAACNNANREGKNGSLGSSSPSIVFSDNEDNLQELNAISSIQLLRSQPLLKQAAEDDSILGNDFSDDEVDEEDHLNLSGYYRHQLTDHLNNE